jgi:hypothetical protein
METTPQSFKDAVKLTALFQAVLEQMDTLKGTNLYRQRIKHQIKALESSIEKTVFSPIRNLDNIDADLFTHIQNNIEMILDMDLTELSQLKVVVDESREYKRNKDK